MDKPVDKPADRPMDKPVDKPTDRPMDKPVDKPTDKTNKSGCGTGNGSLPGSCAPLAFPYIPTQENDPARYNRTEALQTGTLFPGLNLPFKDAILSKGKLENTALAELMALDFAVDELGLYLTTHPNDQEVLDLYWSYIKLANEGRQKYEKMYGPLFQTDIPEDGTFSWLKNPWPWDEGGKE
jgi:spore coat protein JB